MKKSNKIKVLRSEKRDLKKEIQFFIKENNSYLASLESAESDVSKLEDELIKCNSETCGAILQIEALEDDNKDLIKSIQRYKGMIKKLEADAVARNVKEFGTEYHPDDVAFDKKHFSDDFLDQLKSFNTKDAEDVGLSDEFISFGERLYNLKHFGTNYNPADIVESSVVRGRPNFDKKDVVEPSSSFSSRFMPKARTILFIDDIMVLFPTDTVFHSMIPPNGVIANTILNGDYLYITKKGDFECSECYSKYKVIPELVPDGMVYDKESDTLISSKMPKL